MARDSYNAFPAKDDAFTAAFDASTSASKSLASTNEDEGSSLSALQVFKVVVLLYFDAFKASAHAFHASVAICKLPPLQWRQ
jgi:hypothetical protein